MEIGDLIKSRRSIRKFMPGAAPEESVVREIVADACWAPSWGNTQPWEVVVVTGAALERFKEANRQAMLSGKPIEPDLPMPVTWPEANKSRYKDLGKSVLGSQSIARDDHAGRMKFNEEMYALFDAPVFLLVLLDKELSVEYAMLDVGLFLQSLFLLAQGRGLGTAPLAVSVSYPDIIRSLFSIPDNKRVVIGVALGKPEPNAPINRFERRRADIGEIVRWVK